jgi:hypothetical protein
LSVSSQDLSFSKAIYPKGTGNSTSKDIVFDKKGNLYQAGQFSGTLSINKQSLSSKTKISSFLTKYTNDGEVVWLKVIESQGHVVLHSVLVDEDYLYISGAFGRTCDFGTQQLKASDYQDNFIAKYSTEGELVWAKQVKANTKGNKTLLVKGKDNQILLTGSFYKFFTWGEKTIKAQSSADIFIATFTSEGELENIQHITGAGTEQLNDLLVDEEGTIYLAGLFSETIDFGKESITSNGKEDLFVACYKDFQPQWVKTTGSIYDDYASKLLLKNNELIVGGSFSGELKFDDKTLVSQGALDAFVCSYSLDGQVNWAKSFGSHANEYLNALAANRQGQIYISGNFRGEIRKDTSKIKSTGLVNDLFLAKYEKDGGFAWAKNYGGEGTDFANQLFQTPDNYLYLSGSFEEEMQLEKKTLKTKAGNHFFIARFFDCYQNKKIQLGDDVSTCGTEYHLKAEDGFATYRWSNGPLTQSTMVYETGLYKVVATDSTGCESSDDIQVTLHPSPEVKAPESHFLCYESSVKLDAGEGYESYLWSTGAKSRKINIYQEGEYSVEVSDEFGCNALTSFLVEAVAQPDINLETTYIVSLGDELKLKPAPGFKSYTWSTSSTKDELNLKGADLQTGLYDYWLEVSDEFQCTYHHDFTIEVKEKTTEEPFSEPFIVEVNPNPSDGKFRLSIEKLPEGKEIQLRLFTLGGTFIEELGNYKYSSHFFNKEMNLQHLSKGTYLLNISCGNESLGKELIIQ